MADAKIKKAFMDFCNKCKSPTPEFIQSGHRDLFTLLEDTQQLDVEYMKHVNDKITQSIESGNFNALNFSECCTLMTLWLRQLHWTDASFSEYLENDALYKLVKQAIDVMP